MPDRLVVNLTPDGQVKVLSWPDGGLPEELSQVPLAWPLDADALEDLRWYLEDYLLAPYGVWEDRGPAVRARLAGWGDEAFESVFGSGPARSAYEQARDRGLEVVFRSADPELLGLPWELMRDGAGPVALEAGGISRSLPTAGRAGTLEVPGGRLRVLMVIARPAGTADVGYQMVARPLLERLEAVRGDVQLTVLRPPTFDALSRAVKQAADAGMPFHVVHFDGHGVMPGRSAFAPGEGALAFERHRAGSDLIGASKVAAVLAGGQVPVVVLNACQSGAVGKELEASVATALLKAGCAAVVAMAYSVYAVAAAEFMAAFYEALFIGASVGQAVTAGRRRLFDHDGRPSPKGNMPLADWLVPVHYLRKEVHFPQAQTTRPVAAPSLDAVLDQIRGEPAGLIAQDDPLSAVDGMFVGRDDLFYQLESAARLHRVVVLAGPGGTGKTELAKGFARWWRATGGVDDPNLVFWHSFEPGVASFGLNGVITGLGLAVFGEDFARQDSPERLAQVKRLLMQHRVLLVWDNFETVREMPDPTGATLPLDDAGCAQLREFLDWMQNHSSSVVIITSRTQENWLGQVGRIETGGLNRAEAAEYADYLLSPFPAARERRERRSFGELLDWLDGHPLAMRLTLPRLDTSDPVDLLAALQGTTPLPDEDAGPGKLSSLGACITYSFVRLSEQTRRLLPVISLFYGVADKLLLSALCADKAAPARFAGASEREWTAVLSEAAHVGLLTDLDGLTYQIHPALPGYLAAGWRTEALTDYLQEREACERALSAACADISRLMTRETESERLAIVYTTIGLLRRTLGAVLGRALDQQAWDDASAIIQALDMYWYTRGLSEEADAWANRILNATADRNQDMAAAETSARWLWVHATHRKGIRQREAGQQDRARQTYQRALTYLRDQSDSDWTRSSMGAIYDELGMTALADGRLDEADEWYHKSLVIAEDLGDRPNMATSYHHLGMTAQVRADNWTKPTNGTGRPC